MATYIYFYVFCVLFVQAQSAATLENYQAMKNETEEIEHSTPSADVFKPSKDLIDEAELFAGETESTTKTTSGPTTMDPETARDNILTAQMMALINSGTGSISGNTQYWLRIERLKEASTWPKSDYVKKRDVYKSFLRYNSRRLSLEQEIRDRIRILNWLLIPDQEPGSTCSKFYLAQVLNLQNALNKKNSFKAQALEINSKECKSDSDDCDYSLY